MGMHADMLYGAYEVLTSFVTHCASKEEVIDELTAIILEESGSRRLVTRQLLQLARPYTNTDALWFDLHNNDFLAEKIRQQFPRLLDQWQQSYAKHVEEVSETDIQEEVRSSYESI